MTTQDTAQAPVDLTIEVYTTSGRPFVSAVTPEGPGDVPTWSPSSATLIYGDHDAIVVDTLATYDQVDALADWINTTGRRLSRIYITHGHGDHWLGLARLIQRFPGANGLATAEVLARAEFEAADPSMAGYWDAIFPGEVPAAADKVLPQLLTSDTIDLEGSELRIIRVAARVAEVVLRDERAVIPIGSYNTTYGVTLSLPSVVGRAGVVRVLEPDLSAEERQALQRSAETLQRAVARMQETRAAV